MHGGGVWVLTTSASNRINFVSWQLVNSDDKYVEVMLSLGHL